jgi:hypothetical protein
MFRCASKSDAKSPPKTQSGEESCGLLRGGESGPGPVQFRCKGSVLSEINVPFLACHSSLSNGAVSVRKRMAGHRMGCFKMGFQQSHMRLYRACRNASCWQQDGQKRGLIESPLFCGLNQVAAEIGKVSLWAPQQWLLWLPREGLPPLLVGPSLQAKQRERWKLEEGQHQLDRVRRQAQRMQARQWAASPPLLYRPARFSIA